MYSPDCVLVTLIVAMATSGAYRFYEQVCYLKAPLRFDLDAAVAMAKPFSKDNQGCYSKSTFLSYFFISPDGQR